MRLANLDGRAVLLDGDTLYDVASHGLSSDPMAVVSQLDRLAALPLGNPVAQRGEVTLGPPVPRPSKVFAIGLNYPDHTAEGGFEAPTHPLVFTKFPSCIVGPTADIAMRSDRCDYEGELVVVIGREARDLAPDDALSHVAGFTVGQDVSDRRTQFAAKPAHFALGKSFDTFGPTGPVLVTPDEVSLPDLRIRTWVNDVERQNDVVASMLFDVPTIVAYLSRVTTLIPGDLIFTGTPEGIGAIHRRYLADGDVVRTTIDGIGSLVNRCFRSADHGLADLVRQ
ncbi:MAG: fumarylacetoacetate hydrolase family protein [Myxococcota bacterium]